MPYFNFEDLFATYALIVHLVISIVGVAATLVFHESKAIQNEMGVE